MVEEAWVRGWRLQIGLVHQTSPSGPEKTSHSSTSSVHGQDRWEEAGDKRNERLKPLLRDKDADGCVIAYRIEGSRDEGFWQRRSGAMWCRISFRLSADCDVQIVTLPAGLC